jgi:hypothetical protein
VQDRPRNHSYAALRTTVVTSAPICVINHSTNTDRYSSHSPVPALSLTPEIKDSSISGLMNSSPKPAGNVGSAHRGSVTADRGNWRRSSAGGDVGRNDDDHDDDGTTGIRFVGSVDFQTTWSSQWVV